MLDRPGRCGNRLEFYVRHRSDATVDEALFVGIPVCRERAA